MTMWTIFSASRKIDLGCTVNRYSGSPTVVKNALNKKPKIKRVTSKWKTSVIILQIFVFGKTYHLVIRDSALTHPENAPSVHSRVHFFKVYFFVSCFPTMPLNRMKLKYGTTKLNAYEKIIWMIELGPIYLLKPKGSLLVHFESVIWVYLRLHFLWCD